MKKTYTRPTAEAIEMHAAPLMAGSATGRVDKDSLYFEDEEDM